MYPMRGMTGLPWWRFHSLHIFIHMPHTGHDSFTYFTQKACIFPLRYIYSELKSDAFCAKIDVFPVRTDWGGNDCLVFADGKAVFCAEFTVLTTADHSVAPLPHCGKSILLAVRQVGHCSGFIRSTQLATRVSSVSGRAVLS